MTKFKKLFKSTVATSMLELGLIASGVSAVAIPATQYLSGGVNSAFASVADVLQTQNPNLIAAAPGELKLVTLAVADSNMLRTPGYETQDGKLYSASWIYDGYAITLYRDGYSINPLAQVGQAATDYTDFANSCEHVDSGTATRVSATDFECHVPNFAVAANFTKYNVNVTWYSPKTQETNND